MSLRHCNSHGSMELALLQNPAPHRQHEPCTRIKLQFENHGILTSKQLEDGLSASWFLLRPHLRFISDLAADITSAFHLHISCPHGITLQMESFTLPPSQQIDLLKDKDIVNVVKRAISSDLLDERFKHGTSSSLDDFHIGSRGIKLCAPDEFEKETGGYESEKEEEPQRMKFDSTIGASKKKKRKDVVCQRDTDLMVLKSKKKKRKRTASERDIEQDTDVKLHVVHYAADGFLNSVEKSKKKKKSSHHSEKNGAVESSQEKNATVRESPKTHKKENEMKWHVEGKENMDNGLADLIEIDSTKRQKDLRQDSHSTSSTSENLSNRQGTQKETETVKKLSRSTLRKKAKRRWKQEQKKMLARNIATIGDKQSSLLFAKKNDDDGEAEEEQLPIVVRPGHIRFEPLDEDDDNNGCTQQNNPCINWNDGMTKRKGQSWGQEKSRRGKNQMDDNETDSSASQALEESESQIIQYETLPCLGRSIQKGDIIAYRMLELAASLCPEVSAFRIGEVVEVDTVSGALKLAEIPENSLKLITEGKLDQTEYHGEILELVLSDLVDVRLVEGSLYAAQNNFSQIEVTPSINPIKETDILQPADHMDVENGMRLQTTPCMNDVQAFDVVGVIESSKPKSPLRDITSAWKEISETLEKRKEELVRDETKKQDKSIQGCELTGDDSGKRTATPKHNRTWIRRAGGLGATMALLRSQMSSEIS